MTKMTFGYNNAVRFVQSDIPREFKATTVDKRFMTNISSAEPEAGKSSYVELVSVMPEEIKTNPKYTTKRNTERVQARQEKVVSDPIKLNANDKVNVAKANNANNSTWDLDPSKVYPATSTPHKEKELDINDLEYAAELPQAKDKTKTQWDIDPNSVKVKETASEKEKPQSNLQTFVG